MSGTVDLPNAPGLYEVYATSAATVEGVSLAAGSAAVFRYHASAWTFMIVGTHTTWQTASGYVPPPDSTPPTGGTLTVTGTGNAGTTRTLTVTGASDSGAGLHAQPYSFSVDGGTTWSAWQSSTAWTTPALAAGTYQPRARVRDAASTANVTTVSAANFTVTEPTGLPFTETFTAPDATNIAGRTIAGFTWGPDTGNDTFVNKTTHTDAFIYGNRARPDNKAAIIDVGATNVRVTADVSFAAGAVNEMVRLSLCGASVSGGAYHGINLRVPANGNIELYSGTSTIVSKGTASLGSLVGGSAIISVEYDGTTITVKRSSTTVITASQSGLTGTKVGLGGNPADSGFQYVDNFKVEAL